ncbi:hypothetical protein D3C73_1300280 [compost metagenome]
MAGEQLGLHGFIGVEGVVDDLDAGGFLEFGQGVFADVVGPVVEPQGLAVVHLGGLDVVGCYQGSEKQAGNHREGLAHSKFTLSSDVGSG